MTPQSPATDGRPHETSAALGVQTLPSSMLRRHWAADLCRRWPPTKRSRSPLWPARRPLSVAARVRPFVELARLDKPIGTWLLYWPCAWSITLAAPHADLSPGSLAWTLALFGTGAVIMRGAGCTINDLWDREIDRQVDRTKSRPLADGRVTVIQALGFLGLQLTAGLAVLTQLNTYSIGLGAASLVIVAVYPLMKRITYWPQLVLGLAFNWGALLGSSAVLGVCDWAVALPLYLGSIGWTLTYDTIYAHQDKVDDVLASVKSTALLFADHTKPILTMFSAAFVASLAYVGLVNGSGPLFYGIGVGGAAAHLTWQLWTTDLDERASCWAAFKSNRDLGFLVWSGAALDYLVRNGLGA